MAERPSERPAGLRALFWPALALLLLLLLIAALVLLPLRLPQRAANKATEPEPEPVAVPIAEPVQQQPPAHLDQLLQLLQPQAGPALVQSLHPLPEAGVLELTPTAAFEQLPSPARQHQADNWLSQARAIGYDRLMLLDPAGGLLGRSAQVGAGMILLSPPQP
jgi:hypothetical protein